MEDMTPGEMLVGWYMLCGILCVAMATMCFWFVYTLFN